LFNTYISKEWFTIEIRVFAGIFCMGVHVFGDIIKLSTYPQFEYFVQECLSPDTVESLLEVYKTCKNFSVRFTNIFMLYENKYFRQALYSSLNEIKPMCRVTL
jgi:hypothetical protein